MCRGDVVFALLDVFPAILPFAAHYRESALVVVFV